MTTLAPPTDPVAAGHAALARGDWPAARTAFEAGLAGERRADAHDGLGWLGWWTSDADLCLESREAAFRAYTVAAEHGAAAVQAGWLAADHLEFRGDDAVARGWIAQARRSLDGLPDGPDHGWVALLEAYQEHAVEANPRRAVELALVAQRVGREYGVPDLEAIGLAQAGLSLVAIGEVPAGLRSLDAAAVVTLSGELQLQASPAWALCMMLAACARLGDVSRAEQWCTALKEYAERYDGRHLLGTCRTSYGCVLTTGGEWPSADAELTAAVADLAATRAGMASSGRARLAALRARQGRTEEARALYEQALPSSLALVGLGELALADGDVDAARDAAERVLRRSGSGALDRLPALELLVNAQAAAGDIDSARAVQAELAAIADASATPYLAGRASLASAELELAAGDAEAARRCAEDAVDCFRDASAPYDAARSRAVLARALTALGREQHARAEAAAAVAAFAALGVVVDPAAPGGGAHPSAAPEGELTARELDVLRLVAKGLSDADIAEQLVVSPHTVHRHVANIRNKLRLPSRAAAVAYAAREGLI